MIEPRGNSILSACGLEQRPIFRQGMQELPGDELFGLQAGSLLSGGRAACPRNAMASLKPSRAADLGIVPLSWRAESAATPNRRFKRRSAITSQARVFSVVKSILGLILLSAAADGRRLSGGQTNARERHVELPKEAPRTNWPGRFKTGFLH